MAWLNLPRHEITLTKQQTQFLKKKNSSQDWLPNKQGTLKEEFKQHDYEIKTERDT